MYILAFETSCDDTSIALFKDNKLIFLDTITQIKEHLETWWVVPEVAARLHANNIFSVLDKVLLNTWIKLSEIDYVACTDDPWLLPSLYVWLTVSKTLSKLLWIPFININHIKAHIFANLLDREVDDIIFPNICLTVSWWHNEIYLWKSLFDIELIWETQDDSAWEAFDKVAKMMWEWFPWWPIISKLASEYRWEYMWIFPKVMLEKDSLNFSFSWLKTAVKREIDSRLDKYIPKEEKEILDNETFSNKYQKDIHLVKKYLPQDDKKEIAYEFEEVVIDILLSKIQLAGEKYNIKSFSLAWWVSANDKLKDRFSDICKKNSYNFLYPVKKIYSQDNAAMVWILAYYMIINNFTNFK